MLPDLRERQGSHGFDGCEVLESLPYPTNRPAETAMVSFAK